MKKQSGFTLIELMVVMAIIAILATAGLSAYTGYIKKSRDTVRIADLNAINTIALGDMATDGLPPTNADGMYDAIILANNSIAIADPQAGSTVCFALSTAGAKSNDECNYTYRLCDGGTGFAVGARFESPSNQAMQLSDDIGDAATSASYPDQNLFEVGSCTATVVTANGGDPVIIANGATLTATKIGVNVAD